MIPGNFLRDNLFMTPRVQWTDELQDELDKAQMYAPMSEGMIKALVKMNNEIKMFSGATINPDDARKLVKRYLGE